jgi:hypothetical protein
VAGTRRKITKKDGETVELLTPQEGQFVKAIQKQLSSGSPPSGDVVDKATAAVYGEKAAARNYGKEVLQRPAVMNALGFDSAQARQRFSEIYWSIMETSHPRYKDDDESSLELLKIGLKIGAKAFITEKQMISITNDTLHQMSDEELEAVAEGRIVLEGETPVVS